MYLLAYLTKLAIFFLIISSSSYGVDNKGAKEGSTSEVGDLSLRSLSQNKVETGVMWEVVPTSDRELHPWSNVGMVTLNMRINNQDHRLRNCGGFAIASKVVLTSAHCLFYTKYSNRSTSDPRGPDMLISMEESKENLKVIYYSNVNESNYPLPWVQKIYVDKVYRGNIDEAYNRFFKGDRSRELWKELSENDWAILVLKESVSLSKFPMISQEEVEVYENRRGVIASYPSYGRGVNNLVLHKQNCTFLDKAKRERYGARGEIIMSNCRATPGSSGSPVFYNNQGQWEVVSILSQSYVHKTKTVSRSGVERLEEHFSIATPVKNFSRLLMEVLDEHKRETLDREY